MSIVLKVQIIGLPQFKAQLRRLTAATAERNLVLAAKKGGTVIRDEAAERAPKRTRTLARSIHVEVLESSRSSVMLAVGTDVVYAAIHEFGGVIKAKNVPYLRFRTADGQWHSVKAVTIPARPYMRPALDAKGDVAIQEMTAVLRQLLEAAA